MFGFPQDVNFKRLWLEALNLESHGLRDSVCIKHFRKKYDYCEMTYGTGFRYKLSKDAVPNLCLPEKSHISAPEVYIENIAKSKIDQNISRLKSEFQDISYTLNCDTVDMNDIDVKPDLLTLQSNV